MWRAWTPPQDLHFGVFGVRHARVPDSVYTEGITKITLQDVDFADVWGGVIKLIGSVKKLENGQVHIMVCPMFVHRGSQLASVDDVFNGIMVRGDATGDVVFYGKGAGQAAHGECPLWRTSSTV